MKNYMKIGFEIAIGWYLGDLAFGVVGGLFINTLEKLGYKCPKIGSIVSPTKDKRNTDCSQECSVKGFAPNEEKL